MENKVQRIEQIRVILQEVDFLRSVYLKNSDRKDYSAPILQSAIACELLLQEVLIIKGFEIVDGVVKVKTDDWRLKDRNYMILYFCTRKDIVCIPEQTKKLVEVIHQLRNRAAHIGTVSLGEMQEFNKAYNAFICWVFNEYNILDDCNEQTKSWFTDYLINLENTTWQQLDETNIEKTRIAQLKRIREQAGAFNKRFSSAVMVVENKAQEYEVIIDEYKKIMLDVVDERTTRILDAIENSTNILSEKIDRMTEVLENLIRQINSYQTLVQNQIDFAVTEEEIERIVQAYANTCVDKIVTEIDSKYPNKAYESEEKKLQASLEDDTWKKLSDESKRFLVSAKVTYNYLINMRSAIDYSGVCLLVTKALEVEMKRRFYTDYMAYLKNTYPGKSNYSKFPSALLNQYKQPINSKEFTLGRVSFTLCARFGKSVSEEQKKNDRKRLAEFSKAKLLCCKSDSEILDILEGYGDEIANITDEYRNKAAHTNELKRVDAEQCFNLVLDVEKLLKRMLDSFEY